MPDMQKVQDNKNKILSVIQSQGPSLPARVARETGISPLFVSAFLAELVSERRLKITNMKVGSSPVYYLLGQEDKLVQFNEYLNSKEKEAFHLIKENQVLEDETQEPAIRVALRQMKDFAIPLQIKRGDDQKLFWKFFLTKNESVPELLAKKSPKEEIKETPKEEENEKEIREEKQKEEILKKTDEEEIKETPKEEESKLDIFDKEKPKPEKKIESNFLENLRKHLKENNLEISKEISEKKKEFISKVKTNNSFGNQEYLLISKEKKKITENDLTIALQKAQVEKMPALIISPGDLDKKAQTYLEEWGNLIKYQKLE